MINLHRTFFRYYPHLDTFLPLFRNKKRTFVYQKFLFCLSKPQAWHIIGARSAAHIIKGGEPPLHIITRQRASSCGLMIYNASH